MAEDPWPDEPAEPDPEPDPEREINPEERWDDPETELPPESPEPEENADIDPEVSRMFWAAVISANVALAGLTIGPMVIFFEGDWTIGGILMLVGTLSLFRVYQQYRSFQQRDSDDEDADTDEHDGDSDEHTDSAAARNV